MFYNNSYIMFTEKQVIFPLLYCFIHKTKYFRSISNNRQTHDTQDDCYPNPPPTLGLNMVHFVIIVKAQSRKIFIAGRYTKYRAIVGCTCVAATCQLAGICMCTVCSKSFLVLYWPFPENVVIIVIVAIIVIIVIIYSCCV